VGDDAEGSQDEEEQEHEGGEHAEAVDLDVLRLRGHLAPPFGPALAAGRLPMTEA
jgi:hypothetical protein